MKSPYYKAIALFIILLIPFTACKNWSKTAKGTTIGAGAGALAGAIIGKAAGNTTTGAIIGAAVGGASGAAIGNYMDTQARELEEDLQNASVERVGEGIKITFDSGILFSTDSYNLKDPSKQDLAELAKVLKKYDDTNIMFGGHTDSRGAKKYNQKLSEDRAKSVAEYMAFIDVTPGRMTIVGYGEEKPVASNNTVEGRQQNRRVEVAIWANDKLKKAAENGEIGH